MSHEVRFDPERVLPHCVDYYSWRPAAFPASAYSWRLRRKLGLGLEVLAAGINRALRNFAEFVHGQPRVSLRMNWDDFPARSVNRFAPLAAAPEPAPFAESDIAFLANYCASIPEALNVLSPRLRAAVLARQGGHS